MIKNSYKLMFFLSLMTGTLITISSNSWFSMWMGLEINLLSLIPLMMNHKNLFYSESALKYFLIQALSSNIFLFIIVVFFIFSSFNSLINTNIFTTIIILILLLKTGGAPLHFWLPSVMGGLTWHTNFILMTWQKIAPLMIFSYCMKLNLMIFIILSGNIFGSFGGLNQTCLRKLMAFSSINHLSWMVAGMIFSESMWLLYFLFYVILSFNVIWIFNNFKLFNITQTFMIFNSNYLIKLSLLISLLSMGGLPPFLGFFPKWSIIESLVMFNMYMLIFSMILMTLIPLYFYIRVSYSALLMNYLNIKWNMSMIFNFKNMKLLMLMTIISMFGLLFINMLSYTMI